jgi:hypothetical protein
MGALNQQKFIISVFWRVEVRNGGFSRALVFMKALEEKLFLLLLFFFPSTVVIPLLAVASFQ